MPTHNSTSLSAKPYGTGNREQMPSSSTSTTLGATVKMRTSPKTRTIDAALTKLDALSANIASAATQAEAALRGRAVALEAAFKAVRKREETTTNARIRQLDERENACQSRERAVAAGARGGASASRARRRRRANAWNRRRPRCLQPVSKI